MAEDKKFKSSKVAAILESAGGLVSAFRKEKDTPASTPTPTGSPVTSQFDETGKLNLSFGASYGAENASGTLAQIEQLVAGKHVERCVLDLRAAGMSDVLLTKAIAELLRALKKVGLTRCAIISRSAPLKMMMSATGLAIGVKLRFFPDESEAGAF